MPEITNLDKVDNGQPCWMPPEFPIQGRLTLTPNQVRRNLKKLKHDEERYHDNVSEKLGFRMRMTCCHSLHISLFFDGTNNNEPYDTHKAKPAHPSNIAKLYHANTPNDHDMNERGFYSYYIPGVGTPFPEIGTYDYYSEGLKYAEGGEDRINWGLVQICNSLYSAIKKVPLTDNVMKAVVKEMAGSYEPTQIMNFLSGSINKITSGITNNTFRRTRKIESLLKPLAREITSAKPKLVSIKLFVYGFSRGAAEARTFATWLNEILSTSKLSPKGTILGLPISIEFLGILDTVPAVGIANIAPIATGHNGWAYGTQTLPKSGLIKRCCHLVSSHEQRQCFALDSIRYPDGSYPENAVEVIYPGMHSDIGGGYPINDQGKARDSNGQLLSQIVLHDMYAAAIDAGAPLAIHPDYLWDEIKASYSYRIMSPNVADEFSIDNELITRFNAWRKTVSLNTEVLPAQSEELYTPLHFKSSPIEDAIEEQMEWMTAWRIARYASERQSPINISNQPFFQASTLPDGAQIDPWDKQFPDRAEYYLKEAQNNHEAKLQKIKDDREKERTLQKDDWRIPPELIGVPLFDEQNSKGQFWEASLEFKKRYDGDITSDYINMTKNVMLYVRAESRLKNIAYMVMAADPEMEYQRLRSVGDQICEDIIYPAFLDGSKNSDIKNIIALYDDQIHDSRAWFMHTEVGIREMLGDYFLLRMIYFGQKWNKLTRIVNLDLPGLELTPNTFDPILDLRTAPTLFDPIPSDKLSKLQIFKRDDEYLLINQETTQEYMIPKSNISEPTFDFLSEMGTLEIAKTKKQHEKFMEYVSTMPNIIKIT